MTDQADKAQNTYISSVFWTSLTLVVLYLGLLVRVGRGNQYYFLISLTLMLLVSNVCSILANTFAGYMVSPWWILPV